MYCAIRTMIPAKARGVRFTAFITECPACPAWWRVGEWEADQPVRRRRWSIPLLSRSAVHYRTVIIDDWFEDTVLESYQA